MKLADMPISPCELSFTENGEFQGRQTGNSAGIHIGMTFRQYAAVKAMQPLLHAMYGAVFQKGLEKGLGETKAEDAKALRKLIAEAACTFADELIAELEKSP